MKVLIFGKTGQVATELIRRAPAGAAILALGREAADLSVPSACADAVISTGCDIIINAAAYTDVDRAETQEMLATRVNADAPSAMARAAAETGVPFLHISTDYVFGGTGMAPWAPDAPVNPLGVYGRSKQAGEEEVRRAGGRHAILRTSWVFSAHGRNFVRTMLALSEVHDRLRVVSDQVGGPTAAADIADALWVMATAFHDGGGRSGTFHFAGYPDVSWADFAREILAQADRATDVENIPTSEYPTPAKRPANSRLDCTSLTRVFEIERPDWRIGLAAVLDELMEHPK